ncbi:hypothetical protein V6N13_123098 [Hibiscus sabdariffa]
MGAREFRCIQGSVDESKVAILQNCAVGLCALPLSIRELATKLRVPELEGFLIMRIVGSMILLMFVSLDIRDTVMNSGISQDCFERVELWSPAIKLESRRVWLEIRGLPIHAWSQELFENITNV